MWGGGGGGGGGGEGKKTVLIYDIEMIREGGQQTEQLKQMR